MESPKAPLVRTTAPAISSAVMAARYRSLAIPGASSVSRPSAASAQRTYQLLRSPPMPAPASVSKWRCWPSDRNTGRGVRSPIDGNQSLRAFWRSRPNTLPSCAYVSSSGCITAPLCRRCVTKPHSHWSSVASVSPWAPNCSRSFGANAAATCSNSGSGSASAATPTRSSVRPRWPR